MSKPPLQKSLVETNEPELSREDEKNIDLKDSTIKDHFLPPINKEKNLQAIVDSILPAKKIEYKEQVWLERASTNPTTRLDLISLEEKFENELKIRKAKFFGVDPIRRQIYDELFVTVNCAERGLLLSRVRDEIRQTILAYQSLLESSIAYGIRKAILVEKQQSIAILERDQERNKNKELTKKLENLENQLVQERVIKEEEIRLVEETIKDENKRLLESNKTLKNVLQKIIQLDEEMQREQHALSENFNFLEEYSTFAPKKGSDSSDDSLKLDDIKLDEIDVVEDAENSEKTETDSELEISIAENDELKNMEDETESNKSDDEKSSKSSDEKSSKSSDEKSSKSSDEKSSKSSDEKSSKSSDEKSIIGDEIESTNKDKVELPEKE